METEYRAGPNRAPRTWFDWLLEGIAIAAVITMFVRLGMEWSDLPDRAPKHWNLAGEADSWGAKGNLWLLPSLGVMHYLLMTMLGFLRLSPQHETAAVRGARIRILTWVKASMLVAFAYISWVAVDTALGAANGLGRGFIPAVLAITAVPVIPIWRRMRSSPSS